MKRLKYSIYIVMLLSFTSCLKSRNDLGGMLTDSGSITTTIAENEYINQDNNVIGFGYYAVANFSFSTEANEEVKFFTARVSQPRATKLNGSLKLKITMKSIGADPIPAGAITIPAEYEIPAFTDIVKDIPIKLKVNKSLLNPNGSYAAEFTITGANQGSVSPEMKTIDVTFINAKFGGRYLVETTVTDPSNYIKIEKNTKPVLLDEGYLGLSALSGPGYLNFFDEYFYGLTGSSQGYSTLVDNLTSGTTAVRYALLYPTFAYNASGSISQVYNTLSGASYSVSFNTDASNKIVYTSNNEKTLEISYNVTLTAPLPNAGSSSRVFKVVEKYTYHPIQVRVF